MSTPVTIRLFFNFRSPYCYLASKRMFELVDEYHAEFQWLPLGGWDGRSPPERAKKKIHIARQDGARWAKKLGVPFVPPPPTTDPTRAGAGSLLAQEQGLLRPYVMEVMHAEWGEGGDIGDPEVLLPAAERAGLARDALAAAMDDPQRLKQLEANWALAEQLGAYGVPLFMINDQIFWGQDRISFVKEYLEELGAKRGVPHGRNG